MEDVSYREGYQLGLREATQILQQRKEFWLQKPDSDEKQAKIRELEVLQLVFAQKRGQAEHPDQM